METESNPSPRQAREMLRQLADDEDAVRYPPIPRWFFVAMAALVAGLHVVRLLPPSDAGKASLALTVVAIVLGARYWLNREGVSWAAVKFTDMAPFLAVMLATFGGCWAVSALTGAWWIWIVGGVVAAAVVLRTGHVYRRAYGDGR
ncbi:MULTISPECIES: hypothetical protein [Polymorphospora]|uniref:Transmembrane protein n=1 Tax=Polymorphospora lycopeni TaxID=3140240 RepID=A0ABV5D1D5_9ACTN